MQQEKKQRMCCYNRCTNDCGVIAVGVWLLLEFMNALFWLELIGVADAFDDYLYVVYRLYNDTYASWYSLTTRASMLVIFLVRMKIGRNRTIGNILYKSYLIDMILVAFIGMSVWLQLDAPFSEAVWIKHISAVVGANSKKRKREFRWVLLNMWFVAFGIWILLIPFKISLACVLRHDIPTEAEEKQMLEEQ